MATEEKLRIYAISMRCLTALILVLPGTLRWFGAPRNWVDGAFILIAASMFFLWFTVGRKLKFIIDTQKKKYSYTPTENVNANIANYLKMQNLKLSEKKWWQWWL